MKKAGAIHVIHIVLLAMTFIGLKNHVTILPAILGQTGRDGWMSVLLGAIAVLPGIWLVIFIMKKLNGEPLPRWLRRKIGRIPSALILYPFAVFLFILAAFTMRETLLWIGTTFLPKTPMLIMPTEKTSRRGNNMKRMAKSH